MRFGIRCSSVFLLFRVGGWGGVGWLEKSDIKLLSTQVVVEVKVGVELGNKKYAIFMVELCNPWVKNALFLH